MLKPIKLAALMLSFVLSLSFAQLSFANQNNAKHQTTDKRVYLFRHAEKQKNAGRNPHLTPQGKRRANNIAEQLKDKKITAIYSTEYFRTMETAQPLADRLGIEIKSYDPRNLKAFAKSILKMQGNIVIVGHSNTTPALIKLLGVEKNIVIEESEYNQLFQLNFKPAEVEIRILKSNSQ